nr:hypothetical protein [Tanacetum cinerariifolium]
MVATNDVHALSPDARSLLWSTEAKKTWVWRLMSPSLLITSVFSHLPTTKLSSPNSEIDDLLVVDPSSLLCHCHVN